eukprot:Opistho-2@16269
MVGTIQPTAGFNAEKDAEVLRKAMKGLGTDEAAITVVLANRTAVERQAIKVMFKQMFGKDLITDLKSELSGNFEEVCLALLKTPPEFDAYTLRKAMKGAGTDEQTLIEVLLTRGNREIEAIKAAYAHEYKRDLEKDIMSETSGHFRRLLVSVLQAHRDESMVVDPAKAHEDADALHKAGEKKWGTDESKFNQIFAVRNWYQLRATFDAYQKISGHEIEKAIKSEFSGDIEDSYLAIIEYVRSPPAYFAGRLYKSMKGAGTDDEGLIRAVITRAELDMVEIKAAFQTKYGKTLGSFIKGDCSGDYKKILLDLVNEN